MYYKELARRLRRRYLDSLGNVVLQKPDDVYSDCNQAASAIADLLTRIESVEADRDRLREAMKPNCRMCDSMHENGNCTEAGGFCTAVPAAHCPLIPKLRARTETAESELEQRKVYYAQMVDALAAVDSKELKETKEKLNAAEARCKRLDEARENANEAAAKWEGMYHMAEARAKMEKWKQAVKIAGAVKDVGAERVAELVEADRDGRCVVYQSGYPIVSHYCRDDDGLYIREVSGVVSQEEYESMGVSDELHQ